MKLEHEGNKYAWYYDGLYGVGRFVRKSDNALSLMETGSDCQALRRNMQRKAERTASPRYSKGSPTFEELIDSLASEYTYTQGETR